jgi:predicted dehydrogenase
MITILGSGFGLYGYLPALVDGCSQRIVLMERYRTVFDARPELKRFAKDLEWRPDETAALDCATGVVLALRPTDQVKLIRRCLAIDSIEFLLLEKPLAASPEEALQVLAELTNSEKACRIGYTVRFPRWGTRLLHEIASVGKNGNLRIHWTFMAHHLRNNLQNWKRFDSQGGGALRFYGIQAIALLAECGYDNVIASRVSGRTTDEPEKWLGIFSGPQLPRCEVVIDSRAPQNIFRIEYSSIEDNKTSTTAYAALEDPFDDDIDVDCRSVDDRRVPILTKLYGSLREDSQDKYQWYATTVRLWESAESNKEFVQHICFTKEALR